MNSDGQPCGETLEDRMWKLAFDLRGTQDDSEKVKAYHEVADRIEEILKKQRKHGEIEHCSDCQCGCQE